MTLPPEQIGDHGQRYEVVYHDHLDAPHAFGWSDTVTGAFAMVRSINLNPNMRLPMIVDREQGGATG